MMGRSATARIASTASATSPRSDIVSTTNASTPPSRSPSACSRKASRASPSPSVPSGARYLPSGPIEPRTSTSRPMASRTSRASLTPRRLISRTCDPRPWTASLNRLAPNVLVSMQSAPAAMYSEWIACTSAGVFRFSTSKQASSGAPRAYRRVPMAPSQRRQPADGRDHGAPLEAEALEDLGLKLAEARLAGLAEDVRNRAPLPGHDHVVGLDEAAAEPAREQPAHRRLPGAHEADQHDVVGGGHGGAHRGPASSAGARRYAQSRIQHRRHWVK